MGLFGLALQRRAEAAEAEVLRQWQRAEGLKTELGHARGVRRVAGILARESVALQNMLADAIQERDMSEVAYADARAEVLSLDGTRRDLARQNDMMAQDMQILANDRKELGQQVSDLEESLSWHTTKLTEAEAHYGKFSDAAFKTKEDLEDKVKEWKAAHDNAVAQNKQLMDQLTQAQRNDTRDPETGRFVSEPDPEIDLSVCDCECGCRAPLPEDFVFKVPCCYSCGINVHMGPPAGAA